MTREEILNMKPGRELDALVAEKVMGWKTNWLKTDWYEEVNPNTHRHKGLVKDFKPSTNISDAWEVVEKLGYATQLISDKNGVEVAFQWTRETVPRYICVKVKATTVPEAICKAALLAVMEV